MRFGDYEEPKSFDDSGKANPKYLSLKDNGDKVKGYFLLGVDDINDAKIYAIHEAMPFANSKYPSKIECLDPSGADPRTCPICTDLATDPDKKERKDYKKIRAFIPFYDLDKKEIVIWDRPVNTLSAIKEALESYKDNFDVPDATLTSVGYEIKRNGAKGSKSTTYLITPFPIKKADKAEHDKIVAEFKGYPIFGNDDQKATVYQYDYATLAKNFNTSTDGNANPAGDDNFGLGDDAFPLNDEDIPF